MFLLSPENSSYDSDLAVIDNKVVYAEKIFLTMIYRLKKGVY